MLYQPPLQSRRILLAIPSSTFKSSFEIWIHHISNLEKSLLLVLPSMSSHSQRWIYEVFINFRGEDTRKNFVSHLYAALSNLGVNTFLDDENLLRDTELREKLMSAIRGPHSYLYCYLRAWRNHEAMLFFLCFTMLIHLLCAIRRVLLEMRWNCVLKNYMKGRQLWMLCQGGGMCSTKLQICLVGMLTISGK